MKIVVCIKPVPDPKQWDRITLDPQTKTLRREGISSIISPLDKHALEAGLRLKEEHGGEVVVISMAPLSAIDTLQEALAMGADRAVLLSDRHFAGADTLATAYVLACGIRKLGDYDLVLCGIRSLDGSTGHVALQLAEFLGVPGVIQAMGIEMLGESKVRVRSKLDGGYAVLEGTLPLVVAVNKEGNEPRFVTLMGIVEARSKGCKVWGAVEVGVELSRVGLAGSPTQVDRVFIPERKRRREMLSGEPAEIARLLVERLRALGAFADR